MGAVENSSCSSEGSAESRYSRSRCSLGFVFSAVARTSQRANDASCELNPRLRSMYVSGRYISRWTLTLSLISSHGLGAALFFGSALKVACSFASSACLVAMICLSFSGTRYPVTALNPFWKLNRCSLAMRAFSSDSPLNF